MINACLQSAVKLIEAGDLDAAEATLAEHLRTHSMDAHALYLMGGLQGQRGNFAEALALIDASANLDPQHEGILYTRARLLSELGRVSDAIAAYGALLDLNPQSYWAHLNRGVIFVGQRSYSEAMADFQKAAELDPLAPSPVVNQATLLKELGKHHEALLYFEQARRIDPENIDALVGIGLIAKEIFDDAERKLTAAIGEGGHPKLLSVSGLMKLKTGEVQAARTLFERSLDLDPLQSEVWSNLGLAFERLERYDLASRAYSEAVSVDGTRALFFYNLGNALARQGDNASALKAYDEAIKRSPDHAKAWSNKGLLLAECRQDQKSLEAFRVAIGISPDYADAHWNRALTLLRLGLFEDGWREYEWRWKTDDFQRHMRGYANPGWIGAGAPPKGRVLVWSEQGHGDTLQFARFLPALCDSGLHVLLDAQQPLKALLSRIDKRISVVDREQPIADFNVPLLSLPLALGISEINIPSAAGYLSTDPTTKARWGRILGDSKKFRVGLVWSGNPNHKKDRERSIPVSTLLPLLLSKVEFICLQPEVSDADRLCLTSHPNVRFFANDIKDYEDTAALIELVDLVISVDTSVAHLAGGLGKSTWVLLPFVPDFRWLWDRTDSPWYQSVRLFRCQGPLDWGPVVRAVKDALVNRLENAASRPATKTP